MSHEDFLREMLARAVEDLGAEVCPMRSVGEWLAASHRLAFDVVIVTATAPFLCGRNPIPDVRPAGLRRPAVYVVAWQQAEQTVLSLLECGVDQYLTLPVSLGRLRRKVAEELENV